MTQWEHTPIGLLWPGDCFDALATLDDASVDCVLTDLPYGTTRCKWDTILDIDRLWSEWGRVCKKNAPIILTASQPFTSKLVMSKIDWFKYAWTWQKENSTGFLNAKKQPLRCTEDVLVFYREQPFYEPQMRAGFRPYSTKHGRKTENYWGDAPRKSGAVAPGHVSVSNGERYPINLLQFPRDKEKLHPTQKPVALFEYFLKTYTRPGDVVLDCTAGSGTTGVAATNLGRYAALCEIEPKYQDVIRGRLCSQSA